ncbi:hypothetical protein QUF80_08060 [Desulfococcaceae bacterium HSG8]|nr:hypothetical protein [Desulfococcaceae bacterium HSG8]
MLRLLIFFGTIYLSYKLFRSWVRKNMLAGKVFSDQVVNKVDDIMVKDPFCEIYFPKREGVHLSVDGKDLHFCSAECRDKFIALSKK